MKYVLHLCFLLLLSTAAMATHNRAGEILYKRVAPYVNNTGSPVYNYSITVIRYFDDGPNVADRCEDTVYFGDGNKAVLQRINGPATGTCNCAKCGDIIVADPNYRVKLNIYTIVHTYAGTGFYTVSTWDPSRNSGIHNIPNSDATPFYIESLIIVYPTGNNSSPVLSNPPVYKASLNNCFEFSNAAYDADGDSLSYELVPCMEGYNQPIAGYTYPETGSNGSFSIDAATGLLTWCKPQYIDQYNVAIRIKEWRRPSCGSPYLLMGYVLRDMQIIVNAAPSLTFVTAGFRDTCVSVGTPMNLTFTASIAGQGTGTLSAKLLGEAAQYTLVDTTASNSGSLVSSFNWLTACNNASRYVSVDVQYKVPAPTGLIYYYGHLGLRVVPPAPTINNVVVQTSQVTFTWTPANGCASNLQGYNIYRKIGSFSWVHGPCETGVPASSGFQLIGSTSASVTSFSDVNLWTVPNGSTGNYIVTSVLNDCSESFASTVVATPLVVGFNEQQAWEQQVQVYPNPFNNNVSINLGQNYQGPVHVAVYAVNGALLLEQDADKADGTFNLSLHHLPQGLYMLQLKTVHGSTYRKLVRD